MIFQVIRLPLTLLAATSIVAIDHARVPNVAPHEKVVSESAEEGDEALAMKALRASPEDIGVAYLVNKSLIEMTEIATGGIEIHTPEGVIDEESAARKRKEFETKLQTYQNVIMQRGFADFEGRYAFVSASPSCTKSGSLWLGGAVEQAFQDYAIAQNGFALTLTLSLVPEAGQTNGIASFELEGVAVESALVLADPINSDYYLKGRLFPEGRLELRPRLDVLDGWPKWAGPPKKRDLEKCVLTLERIASE